MPPSKEEASLSSLPSASSATPEQNADREKSIHLIAVGDTGRGNTAQYQVAKAIQKKCDREAGCDFAIVLGDVIYPSGPSSSQDPQFKEKFENPYQNLHFPFHIALGNHDYGQYGKGELIEQASFAMEYAQTSPRWKLPNPYYHFKEKEAEFFIIDTQTIIKGWAQSQKQKEEVSNWIQASAAQWKIMAGHHPYKSNGPHGNAGKETLFGSNEGQRMREAFEDWICGKVDIYLAGHDHNLQWIKETCKGTQLIVSGAGSEATHLPGQNEVNFQSDKLGFVFIAIEDTQLKVEFINAQGETSYAQLLTK
ncbi:metallophosphoesterase [Pajaroellobacter abortibovis]|uniref:Calcineurin-like phosphoesterase domain-containing protein n=1 Tax=Pajaroellobacter abortibovis TaxID=1882918 RepID=A0A1L6MZ83_9BACT|nr:metallophosphoesterase [Pajaroellobacter abortibovis]APS00748.1 hypothetical protein BCY86_08705 [Pajaroellobacter abortibovis]